MNLIPLCDGDLLVWATLTTKKHIDWLDQVAATDEFVERIEELFENKAKIFLTSTDRSNFRYARGTIKPYKGNRPSEKPRNFVALRDYLVNFLGAVVVYGAEADDGIASSHIPGKTIICSYDKDMLQLPGHIYNTYRNTIIEQAEETAWLNFYSQMIIGDTSDNVPGIAGLGVKKAPRLLEGLTKEEMEVKVRELYDKQYGEGGKAAFDEVHDLLWLKRDLTI